jgi:ATP-dependent DNA ligase
MKFLELAQYFDKLEETSSRNELVRILSELYKRVSPHEIGPVTYLIQGRLAPFFDPTEIGMGEKYVIQAMAIAYKTEKDEVARMYSRLGDLGLVSARLAERARDVGLSIENVYGRLLKIAHSSGVGSVESKLTQLADLLDELDPVSAKHLVRIPIGKMRLGIGGPTVLDALSFAKTGDKSLRKTLQAAYERTSDLGLIAGTFWGEGEKGVEELKIMIGKPVLSQLAERLPNPEAVIHKLGYVGVQPKYDGFRCVTGYTPIYVKGAGATYVRNVKIGDLVLAISGLFKPVVAKESRVIEKYERLFRFQTYLGEEIKVSEGHKILFNSSGREIWKPVEEIREGDEVIFPLPKFSPNNPHPAPERLDLQTQSGYRKEIILNDRLYRFLGFWIGGGFPNDFRNTEKVGLIFNDKKKQGLADFYETVVSQDLHVPRVARHMHRGASSLYWVDGPFRRWLSINFRKAWSGKSLPDWFVHVSKENFLQFLQGWIESDGSFGEDGIAKIVTKEKSLASLVQLTGLALGVVIGFHYSRVNGRTYYTLVVSKRASYARIVGDKLIVRVLRNEEVTKRDPRTRLYDIQVADDKSFCVPLATLHNCQIHKNYDEVSIYSRNLENMSLMFPELTEAAKELKVKTAILDGEAIAYNPETDQYLPFQETTKRRRKHDVEELARSLPLKAFIFDILYKDGKPLTDLPYEKRLEIADKTVEGSEVLLPAPLIKTDSVEVLTKQLLENISNGLEGVMVKRLDSVYQAGGRNFNWVKLKRHSSGELSDTVDLVLLGYYFGKGKRTVFGAGGLLAGVYDNERDEFVTITKIGTGLSDDEWREIHKRGDELQLEHKPARVDSILVPSVWIRPEIVVEVMADEITKSPVHTAGKTDDSPGYALRFPRIVGFRDKDKNAEDATTVKEITEMYKQQYKNKAAS